MSRLTTRYEILDKLFFTLSNVYFSQVLNCPEFCKLLLLLCNDLKDSDIPHQMKGRALIIVAWKKHFMALHAELAVHTL